MLGLIPSSCRVARKQPMREFTSCARNLRHVSFLFRISLPKDLVHQEELDNRIKNVEDQSRVGNSLHYPRVGCARATMLRTNEQEKKTKLGRMVMSENGEEENNSEKDLDEDVPEEEMPVIPRPMDVDVDENYLQYLEELQRHPECSPIHNSQAFAQHPFDDTQYQFSDSHNQPSFNISGVCHLQLARVYSLPCLSLDS
ncbi:hypothetical protein PIB30_047437 [Stylosanthes scabra]|uniref:Uncharacterized protein n=1 Tax=Stylosanthes scabra TaxID=79078 RepID=A0ABU6VHQ7_9FABA|nr:hypothetical protein [Stylosanthes scabra]